MFLEMDPNDIVKNYDTLSQGIRSYNQGQTDYLQKEKNNIQKDTNLQWERDLREYIDREKTVLTIGGVVVSVLLVATFMLLPRINRA